MSGITPDLNFFTAFTPLENLFHAEGAAVPLTRNQLNIGNHKTSCMLLLPLLEKLHGLDMVSPKRTVAGPRRWNPLDQTRHNQSQNARHFASLVKTERKSKFMIGCFQRSRSRSTSEAKISIEKI